MVTFEQAFANTKEKIRLSIKTKLEALNYDLEGELDDSVMGLQEQDMDAAGLTKPETTALKRVLATITGTGVLQFPQSPGELQARTKYASQFAADIPWPAANGTDSATVVADNVIVTFAHDQHKDWKLGDIKEVHVHSATNAKRRRVLAQVFMKTAGPDGPDVIALKVEPSSTDGVPVRGAVTDFGVYAGQPYILLGQSAQAQQDLTSMAHGSIAATQPDAYLHIRGDSESGLGDSGGGVFAAESGKLIGVCVGNDEHTKKSIFLPTASILTLILQAHAAVCV